MLSPEESAREPEPPQPLFAARSAGPTVQRLVLGGHLRRLREDAGITTERAAPAIGGRDVMRAQVRHLIQMCDHPAVTRQILPFAAGPHRAMGGPFTVLRFTEPDLRDVVFIEQLTSALYLGKQAEVDAYLEIMEEVCLQAEPSARTPEILNGVLSTL